MKVLVLYLAAMVLLLPITPCARVDAAELPSSKMEHVNDIQNLFKAHGLLLNQIIEAAYNNKPQTDIDIIKNALLSNAQDIATYLTYFCGKSAGQKFEPLFDNHISLGGEYINAVKNHLPTEEITQKALKNGDDLAAFFYELFPTISKNVWQKMWEDHVKMEAEQADAYFQNDIDKGLQLKNASLVELQQLSTLIVEGIKQKIK